MQNKKFKLIKDIVCSRKDNCLNILNLNNSDKLLTLSGTSIAMFDYLITGQTFSALVEILSNEYNVDKKTLEEDLMNLIISLLYHQIIETV